MAQWKVSFFLGMAKKMKASRSIDERGRREGYEQIAHKPAHRSRFGTRPSYRMSDTRKRNEDRAAGHAAKTNSVYSCSSQSLMRRWIASFVLVLLVFSSVEPASLASVSANKPLCCRKSGKHHCTEMAEHDAQADGSAFRAVFPTCPYRNVVVLIATATALPQLRHALADALPEFDFLSRKAVRSPVFSLYFSLCQRGPPPPSR